MRVYDAQGRLDADKYLLQKDRIGRVLARHLPSAVSAPCRVRPMQVNVEVEQREVSQIIDPRPRVSVGIGRGIYPGWVWAGVPMQRDYQEGRLRVDCSKWWHCCGAAKPAHAQQQWSVGRGWHADGMRQVIKAPPPPAP